MLKSGRGNSAAKRIDQLRVDIQRLDAQIKIQCEANQRKEREVSQAEQNARDAMNLRKQADEELSRAKVDHQLAEQERQRQFALEEARMAQQLRDVENETLRYKAMTIKATSKLARIENNSRRVVAEAQSARQREEEQYLILKKELEEQELEELRLLTLIEEGGALPDPEMEELQQLMATEERFRNELARLRAEKAKGGEE
jgi:SHS2 domain-containing protein